MGDGVWNFDQYWSVNHTKDGAPQIPKPTANGAEASNANLPSRYDVYLHEIYGETPPKPLPVPPNPATNPLIMNPSPGGEVGKPMCQGNYSPDQYRRTFFAAIVNCDANLPPKLPLGPGNQSGVPVAAFGRFFITQPVSAAQDDIVAEIVELVEAGSEGGHNFDQVQLYR